MATSMSGQRVARAKYFRASTTSVARRKWSDWSECSESCLRTRHRLNCDDLAPATSAGGDEENNGANLPARAGNSSSKQVAGGGARKLQARSQQKQPAASQDDDQDYADEGDEDDEGDSCAQVETSKTFEEQNCLGGQCKLLPAGPSPAELALRPAGSQHQPRNRLKGELLRPAVEWERDRFAVDRAGGAFIHRMGAETAGGSERLSVGAHKLRRANSLKGAPFGRLTFMGPN